MTQPNYLFFRIDNAQISMCERLTEFWGAKKNPITRQLPPRLLLRHKQQLPDPEV
jgi:hypothetical protein